MLLGDLTREGPEDLSVLAAQLREPGGDRRDRHRHQEERGERTEVAELDDRLLHEQQPQPLPRGQVARPDPPEPVEHLGVPVLHGAEEQLLLGGVVVVEAGAPQVQPGADLVESRTLVAALRDDVGGCVLDEPATGGPLAGHPVLPGVVNP
ncbi:hypothetical protein HDA37_002413 [Pseudonocardia antarctica]|uniref:Uncharacterized protein n=1 Tax=Pseudonocardia alni TaxID=33907 RepID=A0A852VYX9_PSEA5|nr:MULTISPECIES: hypothetical protein [Pseudonocardia]MCO7191919.1 hypothetical protein [Pseudonocardia sp. McavD-2-B]NYG02128.1 hypothetical protein [Pseudonocardia antarctica]